MTTAIHPERNNDLTDINNLEDLQAEIRRTKMRLKIKEKKLEERWNMLPQETIKATVGSLIPFFLNNTIASKTWNVLKSASALIFGNSSNEKDGIKKNLFLRAKQLGLFAAIRAVYTLWKGK